MPVEVILPRVDMDMTAGKISKWHVKDGDAVKKGAVIFEIETDKAAMEVEAPGEGVIRLSAPAAGESIPVGSVVAFIYGEQEAATTPAVPRREYLPSKLEAAAQPRVPAAESIVPVPEGGGLRATPLARALARTNSLALEGILGSGPRGRIVAEDVRRRMVQPPVVGEPKPPDSIMNLYEPGTFEFLLHDAMRATIARRLVQAKQTIPHFYLTVTCDLDELLAVRARMNAHAPRDEGMAPQWKISVNDFLIKALALALQRVPGANATWTETGMLRHRASDIGVAVAVEGGLFTPVIRNAEMKSLSQIATEMKDLAARARAKKLAPSEYQGGTTAISNLGMFGVEQFSAIINPPQASILAVGAGISRPVATDREVVVRTQMICTLSCDHRVIDGALGAELLRELRSFVEAPVLMLA